MSFADLLAVADIAVRGLLGGDITYAPTVGDAVVVKGVFESSYVRVDIGQPGVASVGPVVFLTLSDLPSSPDTDVGATVTVDSVTYTAHEVQPDGLGGVRLFLHKV